jgi:hypothetical protein
MESHCQGSQLERNFCLETSVPGYQGVKRQTSGQVIERGFDVWRMTFDEILQKATIPWQRI